MADFVRPNMPAHCQLQHSPIVNTIVADLLQGQAPCSIKAGCIYLEERSAAGEKQRRGCTSSGTAAVRCTALTSHSYRQQLWVGK